MSSTLKLTACTPPRNSAATNESEDNSHIFATPGNILSVDPTQSATSGPSDGVAPSSVTSDHGADDQSMQVDEEDHNSTMLVEHPLRRTARNIKPTLTDLNAIQAQQHAPGQKKRRYIQKYEGVQLFPHVVGSKYMHVSFIDLTQTEASQNPLPSMWTLLK